MQAHAELRNSTLLPFELSPSRSILHEPPADELDPSTIDALVGQLWTKGVGQDFDGYQTTCDPVFLDIAGVIDPRLLCRDDEQADSLDPLWCRDLHETPIPSQFDITYNPAYTLSASPSVSWPSSYAPNSVLTDDVASLIRITPRAYSHTFSDSGDGLDCIGARSSLDQDHDVGRRQFEGVQEPNLYCAKPRCNRRFNNRGDRRRHEETVHMEPATLKGYRCAFPQCPKGDKIWTRLDNFKSHLVKAHCLKKNSEYVKEMVDKSARSTRGSDARFPFIEVDPGQAPGDMLQSSTSSPFQPH